MNFFKYLTQGIRPKKKSILQNHTKAAIIDDKIFCCHGGLSPDLQNMEQIRRIMRPTDVPDTGLLCDLLWADPDKGNWLI